MRWATALPIVYDAANNVTALVDPLGNRTSGIFDSQSRQIASVNALSNRATFTYNAANRVTGATNPLGNIITAVYDNLQRRIAAVDALGNRYTPATTLRAMWWRGPTPSVRFRREFSTPAAASWPM